STFSFLLVLAVRVLVQQEKQFLVTSPRLSMRKQCNRCRMVNRDFLQSRDPLGAATCIGRMISKSMFGKAGIFQAISTFAIVTDSFIINAETTTWSFVGASISLDWKLKAYCLSIRVCWRPRLLLPLTNCTEWFRRRSSLFTACIRRRTI